MLLGSIGAQVPMAKHLRFCKEVSLTATRFPPGNCQATGPSLAPHAKTMASEIFRLQKLQGKPLQQLDN